MGTAALDIGGTAIKSGIWTGIKDEIKEVRETPTNARLGGAHVVEQAVKILESYHGFDAIGIVILKNCFHLFAPSILAASYRSLGTPFKAARKIIIEEPNCQTLRRQIKNNAYPGSPSHDGPSIPKTISRLLITPCF